MEVLVAAGPAVEHDQRGREPHREHHPHQAQQGVVVAGDQSLIDQQLGQTIKQRQVGLRLNRQVLGRAHRRFGSPWVDNDNLGFAPISQHSLPHDWVADAEVRSDENDRVRLFEILVRKRRRIKAK